MIVIVKLRNEENRTKDEINKLYDCLGRFIDKYNLDEYNDYKHFSNSCEFNITKSQYKNLYMRLCHLSYMLYDIEHGVNKSNHFDRDRYED